MHHFFTATNERGEMEIIPMRGVLAVDKWRDIVRKAALQAIRENKGRKDGAKLLLVVDIVQRGTMATTHDAMAWAEQMKERSWNNGFLYRIGEDLSTIDLD